MERQLIIFKNGKLLVVDKVYKLLIMSCLRFCFGKLFGSVENFSCEKCCRDGGNVVILHKKYHKTKILKLIRCFLIPSISSAMVLISTMERNRRIRRFGSICCDVRQRW